MSSQETHFYRIVILDEPANVIIDLINQIFSVTFNILLVHAVEWEVCKQMIVVVTQLIERIPTLQHVLLALKLAHLLVKFLFIERASGKEFSSDCDGEILALIKVVINSSWLDGCRPDSLNDEVMSIS